MSMPCFEQSVRTLDLLKRQDGGNMRLELTGIDHLRHFRQRWSDRWSRIDHPLTDPMSIRCFLRRILNGGNQDPARLEYFPGARLCIVIRAHKIEHNVHVFDNILKGNLAVIDDLVYIELP